MQIMPLVVCNMENFDPVGVHTGDSIVLRQRRHFQISKIKMLRDASLKLFVPLRLKVVVMYSWLWIHIALNTMSLRLIHVSHVHQL